MYEVGETPDFEPWGKTARLQSPITISEKIDGTNGVIKFAGEQMFVGSRKRWVFPHDDNFGFALWANDNYEELLDIFGPNSTTYGEWWGRGIQRGYGLGVRNFSPFWPISAPRTLSDGSTVETVPIIWRGDFSQVAVEMAIAQLRSYGSLAAPGFMQVEGVVVQFDHNRTRFKVVIDK